MLFPCNPRFPCSGCFDLHVTRAAVNGQDRHCRNTDNTDHTKTTQISRSSLRPPAALDPKVALVLFNQNIQSSRRCDDLRRTRGADPCCSRAIRGFRVPAVLDLHVTRAAVNGQDRHCRNTDNTDHTKTTQLSRSSLRPPAAPDRTVAFVWFNQNIQSSRRCDDLRRTRGADPCCSRAIRGFRVPAVSIYT